MTTPAHHAFWSLFSGPLTAEDVWLIVGFLGQAMFFGRFLVQWLVSEKHGKSVVPDAFWYLSLSGGFILTVYVVHRQDPVLILGQGVGLLVYVRNIMLLWREKRRHKAAADIAAQ